MLNQPEIPLPETEPDDLRIGHLLQRSGAASEKRPPLVFVGFPMDEGVRRNGGRAGAAAGPDAIRRAFYRMTPDPVARDSFELVLASAVDLGNLQPTGNLERDQAELGHTLQVWLRAGGTPIILGGGHETAYGHFLAYAMARMQIGLLNWDAHPDVRELKHGLGHSGSPFRQALLDPSGACRSYTVAGLIPSSTAAAHLDFIRSRSGRFYWGQSLNSQVVDELYESLDGETAVSFDLDAVDQIFAPGVSAPAVGGLSSQLWLHAAYQAGRCPKVRSIDIVELNPQFDRDGQTARLAAATIWWFIKGLCEREEA